MLELFLRDTGFHVDTRIYLDRKQIFDYINESAKPVKTISPLPKKHAFVKNLQYFASHDTNKNTLEKQFSYYLVCRNRELFIYVQQLRKIAQKISRQLTAISVAKKYIKEDVGTDLKGPSKGGRRIVAGS